MYVHILGWLWFLRCPNTSQYAWILIEKVVFDGINDFVFVSVVGVPQRELDSHHFPILFLLVVSHVLFGELNQLLLGLLVLSVELDCNFLVQFSSLNFFLLFFFL